MSVKCLLKVKNNLFGDIHISLLDNNLLEFSPPYNSPFFEEVGSLLRGGGDEFSQVHSHEKA